LVEADIDPVDDTAVYTCGPKLFMVEMKQHSQTVGEKGKIPLRSLCGPTTAV